MPCCLVRGCGFHPLSASTQTPNYRHFSTFRLPSYEPVRSQWLAFCQRAKETLPTRPFVCAQHFEPRCLRGYGRGRNSLHHGAVPSLRPPRSRKNAPRISKQGATKDHQPNLSNSTAAKMTMAQADSAEERAAALASRKRRLAKWAVMADKKIRVTAPTPRAADATPDVVERPLPAELSLSAILSYFRRNLNAPPWSCHEDDTHFYMMRHTSPRPDLPPVLTHYVVVNKKRETMRMEYCGQSVDLNRFTENLDMDPHTDFLLKRKKNMASFVERLMGVSGRVLWPELVRCATGLIKAVSRQENKAKRASAARDPAGAAPLRQLKFLSLQLALVSGELNSLPHSLYQLGRELRRASPKGYRRLCQQEILCLPTRALLDRQERDMENTRRNISSEMVVWQPLEDETVVTVTEGGREVKRRKLPPKSAADDDGVLAAAAAAVAKVRRDTRLIYPSKRKKKVEDDTSGKQAGDMDDEEYVRQLDDMMEFKTEPLVAEREEDGGDDADDPAPAAPRKLVPVSLDTIKQSLQTSQLKFVPLNCKILPAGLRPVAGLPPGLRPVASLPPGVRPVAGLPPGVLPVASLPPGVQPVAILPPGVRPVACLAPGGQRVAVLPPGAQPVTSLSTDVSLDVEPPPAVEATPPEQSDSAKEGAT